MSERRESCAFLLPVFMSAEEERLAGCLGAVTGLAQQGAEVRCKEWDVTARCHTAHTGCQPHQAGRERDGESVHGAREKVRDLSQAMSVSDL